MSSVRPVYPFSAIVGQEAMKLALLLNAVDPSIGGALIRGEKGTAKSTAVRALPALLPELTVVEGCPFRCAPEDPPAACPWCDERVAAGEPRRTAVQPVPAVELPVAATEDRVAGTFDLEQAIQHGIRQFEPGLLAAANRGILYVDEVNLLPDHLVDVILDAAAMGIHHVEREGLSISHPARFLLVGTMNPEEGELRPQLLDRFGLAAEVTTPRDPALRATVVRRRVAFDADPAVFAAQWTAQESRLRAGIAAARALLPGVQLDDALLDLIARICVAYEVDGLRADIVIYKGAAALAALQGRSRATAADVRAAAELALPHRRRRQPFDEPGLDPELLDRLIAEHGGEGTEGTEGTGGTEGTEGATGNEGESEGTEGRISPNGSPEPAAAGGRAGPSGLRHAQDAWRPWSPPSPPSPSVPSAPSVPPNSERFDPAPVALAASAPAGATPGSPSAASLRRGRETASSGRATAKHGHYVRSGRPRGRPAALALDATIRAAAPHQLQRGQRPAASGSEQKAASRRQKAVTWGEPSTLPTAYCLPPSGPQPLAVRLRLDDVREKVFEARGGRLLLFVVDASGSMAAHRRMALAKGAVRALLLDAYRRRDQVGLIAFRGGEARLVLPPTNSVDLADRRLVNLLTGGRTPLAAALDLAGLTLARFSGRGACGSRPERVPLVVLVSDGRANVALRGGDPWEEALRAAARLRQQQVPAVVIDTESGGFSLGLSRELGEALAAPCLQVDGTGPGALATTLRRLVPASPRWT